MLALLAAFALVLAMAVPAWAEGKTGSITVEKAKAGETYSIYKIFDVVSYDTSVSPSKIVYKVTSEWKDFFAIGNAGVKYITLDKNDQVSKTSLDASNAADFAKDAIEWANTKKIKATASEVAGEKGVMFTDVADGYYLVNTSLGALCSLNNVTGNNALVSEKNSVPSVEKKVKNGSVYDDSNSAKIGDTVDYQTTITITGNVKNVVLHDKMEKGLTFDNNSVKVKVDNGDVAGSNYTLTTSNLSDGCTFEIEFKDDYIANLPAGTQIIVTYSASLNENAVIGTTGNKNDTWLKYGNGGSVTDETKTCSYSFDLVKTDNSNKLLAGAQFELYTNKNCTDKVALVKEGNDYRVASATEKETTNFTSAVIVSNDTSKITVNGLKGETSYWLKEIKAPEGYNELEEPYKFIMGADNMSATLNGTQWGDGGVHVINNAGTVLPSTGGMGTTVFYVVGGGLMAVAVVLLVTKKRMENKR